jgi:hypothetical protein
VRRVRSEWRRAKAAYKNRQTLLEHKNLLEPGLWVFSAWELWVKAGRKLPDHITFSKGNTRGPLFYRPVKALLSPLYWVRVPKSGDTPGEYYAMVKGPRGKREPIFFSDREVLRVLYRPRDFEQQKLRELWDRHVTNSAVVREKTTERILVEHLVPDGVTATIVPPTTQATAITKVFSQYRDLAKDSPFGVLGEYRHDIAPKIESSAQRNLVAASRELVGENLFWSLPVVPVGSDASPDNAIISDDGVAYFVDTEPIYLRPSICHPLSLIPGWNSRRGPLVDSYLSGSFDWDLKLLLPPETRPTNLDVRTRMAWLVLGVLTPAVTPPVIRRKMRPLDGLLRLYGIEKKARQLLLSD